VRLDLTFVAQSSTTARPLVYLTPRFPLDPKGPSLYRMSLYGEREIKMLVGPSGGHRCRITYGAKFLGRELPQCSWRINYVPVTTTVVEHP